MWFSLILLALSAAPSEAPRPSWDVAGEGQVAFTLQRLGVLADLKLRAKHRLYASDAEGLADNFVSLAVSGQAAPVFGHVGAQVDFQPTSFLRLSGGYHFVGYFGALGSLRAPTACTHASARSASDPACDYHPMGLADEPPGRAATGHRLWLEAQLQGRVGPLVLVGGARLEWWLMNDPGAFWVNELYGVPQARADTTVTGGGAVLYAVLDAEGRRPELLVGAADEFAWSAGTEALLNRVGPAATLRAPTWGAMRDVSVQLAVLLYTHERYLQGVPSVALGFSAVTPDLVSLRTPR